MSRSSNPKRLGAFAFGALAMVPLAPAAAQARPVDPEGNDGPPPASQPEPTTTTTAADSHAYDVPSAVSHSAPAPVKHPAPPAKHPTAPVQHPTAPVQHPAAGPSPVTHGTTDVKPTPAPKPKAKPVSKPAPHTHGAPSPVSQGTQADPPVAQQPAPSAPVTTVTPTAPATAAPSAPVSTPATATAPSANAAEHHATHGHPAHHAGPTPIGHQPASPPTAGPSPVTHGTQAVPPAPVAPAQPDPDPVMHPTATDDPGHRGGELPGAGSPPVYNSKTADGPDFSKVFSWAGHQIKKAVYDKPFCGEFGAYDGAGGTAGVCVDLKHHLVQPYGKAGVGAGAGWKVSRPPRDRVPRHPYVSADVNGAAGPLASANGEVRYRGDNGFKKHNFSDEGGINLFGFPFGSYTTTGDSVSKSNSDAKHRRKYAFPYGSGSGDTDPKHRAGAHRSPLPGTGTVGAPKSHRLPGSSMPGGLPKSTGNLLSREQWDVSANIGVSKTYDYWPF